MTRAFCRFWCRIVDVYGFARMSQILELRQLGSPTSVTHERAHPMGLPYHVLVLATALAVGFVAPASAEKVFRQANDLSLGGAEDLDPLSRNTWITPVSMIYSRLMREGANGEASPELATSWTANAEATEWTLTLQPGVTFHDGSEFDSADVAYSLGRIEDPALESPVAAVLGIIDRVEVVDPMTVKIILEAEHPQSIDDVREHLSQIDQLYLYTPEEYAAVRQYVEQKILELSKGNARRDEPSSVEREPLKNGSKPNTKKSPDDSASGEKPDPKNSSTKK
jgi:hypothetical protein